MSLFFNGISIPVQRPAAAGQWIRGRYVNASAMTPFSITGTIQPTDGYKLAPLLEGKRIHAAIEILSDSELFASDPRTGSIGDIITWDGFDWEVIQCIPWENGIIPNFDCFAIRMKEGD